MCVHPPLAEKGSLTRCFRVLFGDVFQTPTLFSNRKCMILLSLHSPLTTTKRKILACFMIIGIQKHMHRSVYIYPTWYSLCLQTRWFEGKFVFSVCDKKCRIGKNISPITLQLGRARGIFSLRAHHSVMQTMIFVYTIWIPTSDIMCCNLHLSSSLCVCEAVTCSRKL